MDVDGGGWTLILKATNRDLDLAYDSPLWTSMELLNETSGLPNAMPLGASAKFPAYNHVEGRELRLEWFTPRLSNHDFTFVLEQSVSALLHFAGPEKILVGTETNGCNGPLLMEAPGYLDTMRIGMGRQFFGINGTDGASGRIRLGFGSNDEPDTEWRPHYGIGTGESSVQWSDQSECENNCGCMGSDGDDASADLSVNLWIR
jgi:hypothetical protein